MRLPSCSRTSIAETRWRDGASAWRCPWACGDGRRSGRGSESSADLPAESHADTHLTLAAVLGARNHGVSVQVADGSVRIEAQIGHVPVGVAEARRIRDVERLDADLQVHLPRQLKPAEHAEIPRLPP